MNRDLKTEVELLLGAKGTGKTPYIVGDVEHGIESEIDRLIKEGFQKFITLDRIAHPKYSDMPIMPKEKIPYFTRGVVRIIEPTMKGMMQALNLINEHVTDAVINYEDAKRIEAIKLSDPSMCIVSNSKNVNNHVKFMYHGWKFVPLDLLPLLDKITMWKINRSLLPREEDELDDKQIQLIHDCFNEVKSNPDPFFRKTIHVSQ